MKEVKKVQSLEEALNNLDEAMAYASHDELVAAGLVKPKGFFARLTSFFHGLYKVITGLVALIVGVPLFLLYFLWNWVMSGIVIWVAYLLIGMLVLSFSDVESTGYLWDPLITEPAFYTVVVVSGILAFMLSLNRARGKDI